MIKIRQPIIKGNGITPDLEIQYEVTTDGKTNEEMLQKDTDYTLSYKDNIDPGTATIICTGTGNYKGTVSKNFEIKYAFVPKQTTASAEHWYNGESINLQRFSLNGEGDDSTILYRDSAEFGIGIELVGK